MQTFDVRREFYEPAEKVGELRGLGSGQDFGLMLGVGIGRREGEEIGRQQGKEIGRRDERGAASPACP